MRLSALKAAGCLLLMLSLSGLISCSRPPVIEGNLIRLEFDSRMYSRVNSLYPRTGKMMASFRPTEYLLLDRGALTDFTLTDFSYRNDDSILPDSRMFVLKGNTRNSDINLEKEVRAYQIPDFPDMIFFRVSYRNNGNKALKVRGWVNNDYSLMASDTVFWSYQGASYDSRPDWVLPIRPGYQRDNFLGMNASDYGGGIPVADIWRKDGGLAVGHVETTPQQVRLPVNYDSAATGAQVSVKFLKDMELHPGQQLKTITTFVAAHRGDHFHSLSQYSRFMQMQGIQFKTAPPEARELQWCAWGYERDFTVAEILGTLPKAREIGFTWATLDDGWQTSEGDWYLNPAKFPGGDKDMRQMVARIHQSGMKAQLWWAPLAVDPGTDLAVQHADMLLLDKDGKPVPISWWDSNYLCPAYQGTLDYTQGLVEKIIRDWGWDGLKIDGQHLNGAPPCYNPAHHHAYPEESCEKLPQFFEMIYRTARQIKPNALIQICPCGTAYSFYTLPFMNQSVASDPTSSWQVRLKGKTLKALAGNHVAYFGDHVELSDDGNDFASTIGVGGVVGTKFTWPTDRLAHKNHALTSQKETEWKKWLAIYQQKMLPDGEYLGELYDLGFDRPEGHVIKKDGDWFYAFYADHYQGKIELRGLPKEDKYTVSDYENGLKLDNVSGNAPFIDINFNKHLLLQVTPGR
jgi:alpha-galactosidase